MELLAGITAGFIQSLVPLLIEVRSRPPPTGTSIQQAVLMCLSLFGMSVVMSSSRCTCCAWPWFWYSRRCVITVIATAFFVCYCCGLVGWFPSATTDCV